MNLILDPERAIYKSAIDDVHDTFARDITVWRTSAQVINSQSADFDAFNDQGIPQVTYVSEFKVFKARIKYIDRQDKEFQLIAGNTSQVNSPLDLTQEFQLVRIKVNSEANNYIKDCEKITVDGLDYIAITVPRPHGVFSSDYFTFYLRSFP